MAVLPPAAHAVLLSAGHSDWGLCLHGARPALADTALYALRSLSASVLWLAFLPFLLLAVMWFLRGDRIFAGVWLVLLMALVTGHLPPAATHHCDAKGLSSEFWPLVLALPAFVLSIAALWTTRRPTPGTSTRNSPS